MHPATALRQSRGFTLVELVTVMVILGVLAAIASPRFFDTSSFKATGFAAEVRAGLRHAQTAAMASGCDMRASLASGRFRVQYWTGTCKAGAGTLTLAPRIDGGNFDSPAPSGLGVPAFAIYFDTMGRPWDDATQTLLVSPLSIGIGNQSITVNPETGFVQ